MKKAIIICLMVLMIAFAILSLGCSKENTSESDIYMSMAQKYVDNGDYESAIMVLEEGIAATDSSSLKVMLVDVQNMAKVDTIDSDVSVDTTLSDKSGSGEDEDIDFGDRPSDFFNSDDNNISIAIHNEEQIAKDIVNNGLSTLLVDNSSMYFEVTQVIISKRKTISDYDEVYVDVTFENENYIAEASYVLNYSYYNVGGWIIDTYYLNEYTAFVKVSPFDEVEFYSLASNYFDYTNITYYDSESFEDSYNEYFCFDGFIYYDYMKVQISGIYHNNFDNNTWNKYCEITSIITDWSGLTGTWSYIHDNGDFVEFNFQNITYTNEDDVEITYSYSTSAWKWVNIYYGQNNTNFSQPTITKDYFFSTENIVIFDVEIEVPSGISVKIQLGDRKSTSPDTAFIWLDAIDGCKMQYWTNIGGDHSVVLFTKTS